MKEEKTERPAPRDWIEKTRQILSVPKVEIDRREAAYKKARTRQRSLKG